MPASLPLLARLAKRLAPATRGRAAELLAFLLYAPRGFWPLSVPQHHAQTDLTLRRNQLILLVEVKYRTSRNRAHLALTPGQSRRLHRQALAVAARHPGCTVRVELCLIFPHWPCVQCIPVLATSERRG